MVREERGELSLETAVRRPRDEDACAWCLKIAESGALTTVMRLAIWRTRRPLRHGGWSGADRSFRAVQIVVFRGVNLEHLVSHVAAIFPTTLSLYVPVRLIPALLIHRGNLLSPKKVPDLLPVPWARRPRCSCRRVSAQEWCRSGEPRVRKRNLRRSFVDAWMFLRRFGDVHREEIASHGLAMYCAGRETAAFGRKNEVSFPSPSNANARTSCSFIAQRPSCTAITPLAGSPKQVSQHPRYVFG